MATEERSRPATEAIDVQQSILQQAQAAAEAQVAPITLATQPATILLQDADLATPNVADDDMPPPPPYGGVHGEVRNEQAGLRTTALVTDDGRVNIRINQLNRSLSRIFTPALRQQLQGAQDSPPPLSRKDNEAVAPPPSMNIVIHVVGSRGDVQPFVALGKVLKDTYGHRVRLATHPNFQDFVEGNGLEFFNIGGDPSLLMAFMTKNPSLMPGFRGLWSGEISKRRRDVGEYIQGCWRSCYEAGNGITTSAASDDDDGLSELEAEARPFVADCIIANPPSFAHIHCAEKLGVPLHIMFTMPYSPTQAFPHPLADIQSSNADPQLTNFMSYAMIELLSWQGLGDIINRFRKKCLGLDPISSVWGPGMLQRLKIPHTYCWSPALIPKPKDWGPHISLSGFYFLNLASDYTPTPDLQAFLDAGPTPVYIGFGSIVLDDPNAMTEIVFEAVRKTGQRILLSQGWGGIGGGEIPDGVFLLGNVPHDWLFNHVSCVVHHGGAGTTAAGIAAGRPTVVVPFFGDQPFWGAMLARAGVGPDPIPHKELTSDKLADAINFCLKPGSLERADLLASKIAAERGSEMGARSFHQHLKRDRLCCTLSPSRVAVWRVKRTKVRLSAFAACTLANANHLDFRDLELHRTQEYDTDPGPVDPVSGGFTAFVRAVNGMAMGLAEIPTETWKTLQLPAGPSRQRSRAAALEPTISRNSEVSSFVEQASIGPTWAAHDQTSLNVSKPNLADLPNQLTPAYKFSSSSLSDDLQGSSTRPSTRDSNANGRNRVHTRVEPGHGKDQDMLRRTGPHTSKGVGRFARAFVQSPVDIAASLTKGCHNIPKLWGDDTVRPQEQVTDFKSGLKAVGREFGYGWYDGVTGLVTQPWKGAQKEGAGGFFKGVGKGVGGFMVKPGAALLGILSHPMKGVHKEVQKFLGSSVQNYIIASRAAQGYEEWMQSSDAEKQEVVDGWKLLQKILKKKCDPDQAVREGLRAPHRVRRTTSSGQFAHGTNALSQDIVDGTPTRGISQSSRSRVDKVVEQSLRAAETNDTAADHRADDRNLRHTMVAGETRALQHASEAVEYDKQVTRVMAQSLWEQRQHSSDSEVGSISVASLDHAEDAALDQARTGSEPTTREATVVAGPASSNGVRQTLSYDLGHLAGTTQSEFERQRPGQQGEKTTQEKIEEEIVIEYIKKQSLLESSYR